MRDYRDLIEAGLKSLLPTNNTPQGEVVKAMEYSVLGGGKRIRGTLTLAFYELFSADSLENVVPFTAAVEMVHAYSLVHDDLPCMDDDEMRRGKPSCHIQFGESTALLAGDALLTLAFEVMTSEYNTKFFTTKQILAAVNALARNIGTEGMIGGQILDLENEVKAVDIERVEETDLLKTGALIAASAIIGGILGGATPAQQKNIETFGRNLGLAFQIVDDILDNTSTNEVLGKPIGSDKSKNKQTYTSFYGVEKAKEQAEVYTKSAITALRALKKESRELEAFALGLINRIN